MKRGTTTAPGLVIRRYGVRDVLDWRPELEAELRRANDLWNKFVEGFRSAEERYRAAVDAAGGADAAALDTQIAALTAHYEEARKARAAARKESRRRVVDPDLAATERQLRAGLQALRASRRALRKHAAAACKTALNEIEAGRRRAMDEARRAGGVYWGTANALQNRFDGARKALLQRRAQGATAEIRYRPFCGEGLIHNQIQKGMPAHEFIDRYLSLPEKITERTTDRVVTLVAWRESDRAPVTVTRYRKGKTETYQTRGPGEPEHVTAAVTLHRPLDPDSRIKDVELVLRRPRRETALTRHRWSARDSRLIVSGECQPRPATCGNEILAINLGWRLTEAGLRVATIVGDAGQEPEHLILPVRLLDNFAAISELQKAIDRGVNSVLPTLRAPPWAAAPEALREEGARLAAAPKVGHLRLARLIARWRVECPDWAPEMLEPLEAWRQADNRLSSRQDAARRRSIGARDDLYRVTAARLCRQSRTILIDKVDWAALKRRPADEAEDLPQAVRRNRQIAAVGELTAALRNAARHTGTAIVEQPGPSTWTWCHVGDHPLSVPVELRTDLRYFCGPCRTWLDQDINNAAVRLARHLSSTPETPPEPGALAAE